MSPHTLTAVGPKAPSLLGHWRVRAAMAVLLALLPACDTCGGGTPDAGVSDGAGAVAIRQPLGDGTLEVRLVDLERPLRAMSMLVTLGGALATSVEPAGEVRHDVVEAALDAPRSGFTLVVSDSRRLPLTEGAIARIATDGPASTVTLENIEAIDVDGNRVTLEVEVP
jgi:hypothetical protein